MIQINLLVNFNFCPFNKTLDFGGVQFLEHLTNFHFQILQTIPSGVEPPHVAIQLVSYVIVQFHDVVVFELEINVGESQLSCEFEVFRRNVF